MTKRLIRIGLFTAATFVISVTIDANEITLDGAIQRALDLHPALRGASQGVSAADARALQAGLWPNPEIDLEVENFGGGDELTGFESAESTAVLSQPFPLGGKPSRRRGVAESDAQLARRDLESVRLDIIAGTNAAFVAVLAAQQRQELSVRLLRVSEDFSRVVQARVDAGKVSPVEATRAQIEASQARLVVARSNRALRAANTRLAASWGSTAVSFDRAIGDLPEAINPPAIDELRQMMATSPEIRRLEDEIERGQRALAFEKSLRIPDLALSVGPRRFQETGDSAWVAGLSVSIPIFDRNQGGRKAAEFDFERARFDAENARVALEAELVIVCEQLLAAAEAARTTRSDVVPAAAGALSAVEIGYREGKFAFIDVIAAQRAFFEASSLMLDSLEEYALARAELERLVGRSLDIEMASDSESDREDGDER